jgi:hypothetical protein
MVTVALSLVVLILFAAAFFAFIFWFAKNSDWGRRDPVVVAAYVAGFTALVVAWTNALGAVVSGSISTWGQKEAEIEKARSAALLSVILQYEPSEVPARNESTRKERITALIQSGIIADDGGSICMAMIKEGCPLKVLNAPR